MLRYIYVLENLFLCRAISDLTQYDEAENQQTKQQTEEKTLNFKFPILTVRTKRFSFIFDKIGVLRGARYVSWLFLALVPLVAGIALYLIIGSLISLANNPAVGQIIKEMGPGVILMIPGINPVLPIVYGWIAIVISIALHEGAHGIVAINNGFNVKSSGLLFFLIIPIGAFVDVDEEQLKKAKPMPSLKVMAAGVGGNILVGAACLLCLIVLVGSLTPIISGVYVNDVTNGMPAQSAGLLPKDVLVSIDNVSVSNSAEFRTILDNKTEGDTIQITVARGDSWQYRFTTTVNLTISANRTVMGITCFDLLTQERLDNYQTFSIERLSMYMVAPTLASGLIPFSDTLAPFYTSPLGQGWYILANLLFWLWFVNFNLAIFNALPIYPLDGGRIFKITLKRLMSKRMSEKSIFQVTVIVAVTCLGIVLAGSILPFLL
jgi:membrane-associated protease RseP (regulator of RpoE activity)